VQEKPYSDNKICELQHTVFIIPTESFKTLARISKFLKVAWSYDNWLQDQKILQSTPISPRQTGWMKKQLKRSIGSIALERYQ